MEKADGAYATAQAARVARLETMEAVRRGPMPSPPNPSPDHWPRPLALALPHPKLSTLTLLP